MLGCGPQQLVLGPRVQQLFERLWYGLPQHAKRYDYARLVLYCADNRACQAAFLVDGGYLSASDERWVQLKLDALLALQAQQEQQLEAAQAAAARSCAYLRCANLGGSGGPAAGQGEGSQRCSQPTANPPPLPPACDPLRAREYTLRHADCAAVHQAGGLVSAMEPTGLAGQLVTVLQQLGSSVGSVEAALAAEDSAAAARGLAADWQPDAHIEAEVDALRSVITGAADRLAALLRTLRQQCSPAGRRTAGYAAPLYARVACEVLALCLSLAPQCGVSEEAQLHLAQAALRCLVSSGRSLLVGGSTQPEALASMVSGAATLGSELQHVASVQLQLAAECLQAPGFTAEAAAETASPAQFAEWLAAAADQLQRLGRERSTAHLYRQLLPTFVDAVMPLAQSMAAALLDWWRRPAAQQGQQLEAAQAAAARSCAYLRCANLGGGGGPAAGQGEGSQRCSVCRAVWYCNTACSHADWRAGHRRVCKALGAARAAEKAARRQTAAEAATGGASFPVLLSLSGLQAGGPTSGKRSNSTALQRRLSRAALSMPQADLAARLGALVARLHAAILHPLEATAAVSLAHDTQAFLAAVTAVHTSPDASAQLAPLTSATSVALPQLTLAMRVMCKRVNEWKAFSGDPADLWLLLAAIELLRIAFYVAEFGTLPHQDQLASGIAGVQQLGVDAAELAPPGELTSRLAVQVTMAKELGSSPATGREQRMALPNLARILYSVAQCPAWSTHAAAVAAHRHLAADALAVMLPYLGTLAVGLGLPEDRRPPGCMWPTAGWVAGLISSATFSEALDDWVAAADGASTAAALAAAAQLVLQLPLEEQQQPGRDAAEFRHTAVTVAALPGHLCVRLCKYLAATNRQNTQQRRRVLAQLLPAVCRLPQLLQWAAGSSQQTGFNEQGLHEATALCPPAKFQLVLLCHYVHGCMRQDAPCIASSPADAAAWAGAAAAALRCLPLLQELHSELLRCDAADAALAAGLAEAVNELQPRAAALVFLAVCQLEAVPEAAACEALQALWALHSATCRRVHWAAAAASSPPFQLAGQMVVVQQVVEALSHSMCSAALIKISMCGSTGSQSPAMLKAQRVLRAMSVAHWQALQACGEHISLAQQGAHDDTMLASLAAMLAAGPLSLAVDPGVCQLVKQLWHLMAQDPGFRPRRLRIVMRCSTPGPRFKAFLAHGGYLNTYMEEVLAAATENECEELLMGVLGSIAELRAAAEPLAAAQESDTASDSALRKRLRHGLAGTALSEDTWTMATVQEALEPAQQLAGALFEWWQRPETQQEEQLEAGQAAAARSCAYLHCANLGGGGGPAAGQGEGSQRCR
ncbi:ubiquitin carboxyl-terminal hydrolase 18-like [Chlorella sorokiniana]|uniref:Ubiquitin carboxyl-terminal hydrolase 18-like n=1 Tax=Chlorella sorokiniana TaxID=3076 RepID=A0A2P6TPK1_CHLSO|nr:ubiquitin carboxyl-terminal hydrolase 18-like [Chlorella sorokiniana]|eukprot:PRW55939.1 ubiquitin carboxyl-terminal hydrolase 18-like [Chlorella sorokiniana]